MKVARSSAVLKDEYEVPLEGVAERGGDEIFRGDSSLTLDGVALGRSSWRRSLHYINWISSWGAITKHKLTPPVLLLRHGFDVANQR